MRFIFCFCFDVQDFPPRDVQPRSNHLSAHQTFMQRINIHELICVVNEALCARAWLTLTL